MIRLNSHQLRKSRVGLPAGRQGSLNIINADYYKNNIKRHPLVLVLDNVQDTYNIGSFFRLADALGAQKIYLCGPVVTPPNIKIHRASIGTWKFIPWENFFDTTQCLKKLKQDGYQIVACEQSPKSVDYKKVKYKFPIALIAGNEQIGVGESSLNLCDLIVEIPMYGINKSLNTLIATSVIGYDIICQLTKKI